MKWKKIRKNKGTSRIASSTRTIIKHELELEIVKDLIFPNLRL